MLLSMLLASWTGLPSKLGSLACKLGNFRAPLVVSSCRNAFRIAKLPTQRAFACHLGPSAFCTA